MLMRESGDVLDSEVRHHFQADLGKPLEVVLRPIFDALCLGKSLECRHALAQERGERRRIRCFCFLVDMRTDDVFGGPDPSCG